MTVKAKPITVIVTPTSAKIVDAQPTRTLLILENKGVDAITIRFGSDFPTNISEVQTITFDAVPTAGVWRITHQGNETGDLVFNANNAAIETALEGLASIGAGNVLVGGTYGAGITLTFRAGLADRPISAVTITINTLDDNTGVADEVQDLDFSAVPDLGDFKLKFGSETTVAIDNTDNAAAVQTALNNLAALSAVAVAGDFTDGFTVTFAVADGNTAQPLLEVVDNTLQDSAGALDSVQAIKTVGHPSAVPTAGTFHLVIDGELTTELAFDANTAAIQAAIDALPSTTGGDIVATGDLLGEDLILTFSGATVSAQPQNLVGVRNIDLEHQEVPLDLTVLETQAGLTGTDVTTTLVETTPGAGTVAVTVAVAETTPGSTAAQDGMIIAGGERAIFDVKAPIDELWAKLLSGSTANLEITTD